MVQGSWISILHGQLPALLWRVPEAGLGPSLVQAWIWPGPTSCQSPSLGAEPPLPPMGPKATKAINMQAPQDASANTNMDVSISLGLSCCFVVGVRLELTAQNPITRFAHTNRKSRATAN